MRGQLIEIWPVKVGAVLHAQVHRKEFGVDLRLSAAFSSHYLQGWPIVQQNDEQPVLSALLKGRGQSLALH